MNKQFETLFPKKFNSTAKVSYWQDYLSTDVLYTNERRHRHYFNDIPYTPWPFYISLSLFLFAFFSVMYMHHYIWAGKALLLTVILVLVPIMFWAKDLHYDSVYFGKLNFKVRRALVGGFLLFLVSEACVFAGFIWAYFDRYFHTPAQMGGTMLPVGIEIVSWNSYPLWGAFILLASGWACNQAYYSARGGSWLYFRLWSVYGHALGVLFIFNIQLSEYMAKNTLSISDSVLGSCYYLITGFHGLHVCIGLLLLTFIADMIENYKVDRDRIFGYALALAYWHFVDWIWLFLYVFLYVINGNVFYNEHIAGPYWS